MSLYVAGDVNSNCHPRDWLEKRNSESLFLAAVNFLTAVNSLFDPPTCSLPAPSQMTQAASQKPDVTIQL